MAHDIGAGQVAERAVVDAAEHRACLRQAVAALKRRAVGRIVLARPGVEAGESLGYLPGTLEEKLDPNVRPRYDANFDMTDME